VIQYAVTKKNGEWSVFREGLVIATDMTRSAAVEMAQALARQEAEAGAEVLVLTSDYYGRLEPRYLGEEPEPDPQLLEDGQEEVHARAAVERGEIDPTALPPASQRNPS
jgi:hypothetical protein